jgi:hypothetical protein
MVEPAIIPARAPEEREVPPEEAVALEEASEEAEVSVVGSSAEVMVEVPMVITVS